MSPSVAVQSSKVGKVHQLASRLTFGTDPSKRPPGGIPIIGSIESGISEIKPFYGSEPEDVFSDTESSINVSEAAMQGCVSVCGDRKRVTSKYLCIDCIHFNLHLEL